MVRRFTSEPVPQPSVDRILASAVRGPSAGFCQGQAFLVLTGQDLPRFWAIAGEATRPSVHAAPLVIVPLSCKRIYIDAYVQKDPSWAAPARDPRAGCWTLAVRADPAGCLRLMWIHLSLQQSAASYAEIRRPGVSGPASRSSELIGGSQDGPFSSRRFPGFIQCWAAAATFRDAPSHSRRRRPR
jgi:nitroreductase